MLGVTLRDTNDGGVEINSVDEGSTAEAQGVTVGARILAVNGEPMHGFNRRAILDKLKAKPKPWNISMMMANDMKMRDFMETMKFKADSDPAKFKPDVVRATAKVHLGIQIE